MPYAAVNGLNMYYEAHGEGRPLLLLHGGANSIPEKWIPLFTPHFHVVAPEQMGHGRTADLVDRPFHYHDMAEDTVELMQQLEIESAAVVGYSDGGIIALDIAIHHPERVSRLAVTGANARFDGYTDENKKWVHTFDQESEPVSEKYATLSPDGAEHWPVFMGRMKPMWAAEPSYTDAELAVISAPTLLIIGDRDIVRPSMQSRCCGRYRMHSSAWSRTPATESCPPRPYLRSSRKAPTRNVWGVVETTTMELGGLEPPTSWVRSRRSPN